MKMRKLTGIAASGALALSMAACGGDEVEGGGEGLEQEGLEQEGGQQEGGQQEGGQEGGLGEEEALE